MMESSRVSEAHAASGAGVYDRDVLSKRQPAVEGPREVDAIAVLQVLANNKMRIVKVTLAAALLAFIVALLLPKRYTETLTVLPPKQNQSAAITCWDSSGPLPGWVRR